MRTNNEVTAQVVPDTDDTIEQVYLDQFVVDTPLAPKMDKIAPIDFVEPVVEPIINLTDLFPDDTPDKETEMPDTVQPDPSTRTFLKGVDYEDTTEDVAPVPINNVQYVPIFPGCESLATNDERISCFNTKMQRIVQRNFNTDIAVDLGLEGINRIYAEFEVTKDGSITLRRIRAPHPALEKEAARVVGLVPVMQPGKMGDTPVGVIYNLPIVYKVSD